MLIIVDCSFADEQFVIRAPLTYDTFLHSLLFDHHYHSVITVPLRCSLMHAPGAFVVPAFDFCPADPRAFTRCSEEEGDFQFASGVHSDCALILLR